MRRRSWRDDPSAYKAALDVCTPEQIAALDESDDENYIRKIATGGS